MKKGTRRQSSLSRAGKIIRNLAVTLVIFCILWAAYDFPMPTQAMAIRRTARQNLIQGPLQLQTRIVHRGKAWWPELHEGWLLLFQTWDADVLSQSVSLESFQLREGGILVFLEDRRHQSEYPIGLLAAGVPDDAAAARLTMHVQSEAYVGVSPNQWSITYEKKLTERDEQRGREFIVFDETYVVEGEKVGEGIFFFQIEGHYPDRESEEGLLEQILLNALNWNPSGDSARSDSINWYAKAVFSDKDGQELGEIVLTDPKKPDTERWDPAEGQG